MMVAIFGVFVLMNRQTAGMLDGILTFIYPIPMVAYAAKFGGRSSIPVAISMALLTLLLGSVSMAYYALSQALIGLVFGLCLHARVETNKTVLLLMVLSAVSNILTTVVFASVFGYNIVAEVEELQSLMNTAITQSGMEIPDGLITTDFLSRIYIISMVLGGVIQGFLVYEISLLILRRLRIPIERPKPITRFFPPVWTGFAGLFLVVLYFSGSFRITRAAMEAGKTPDLAEMNTTVQTLGMCGYMYLIIFGILCMSLVIRIWLCRNKVIAGILAFLCMYLMPPVLIVLGFCYLSTGMHRRLLDRLDGQNAEQTERQALPPAVPAIEKAETEIPITEPQIPEKERAADEQTIKEKPIPEKNRPGMLKRDGVLSRHLYDNADPD